MELWFPGMAPWGFSSAGRALRSHRRGQGFESPILHSMKWTTDAEGKLKEVPFFVRPIVRRKIEGLASEAGQNEIDEAFYEQAKAQFGEK